MPKQSERQHLINELEQALALQDLESSDDSDSDFDVHGILWMTYVQVQCQRYLEPRNQIVRAPDRLEWLLYELDDKRFKQEVRMSRHYFQELVISIENHTIFQNNSNHQQRPVHHQLLVMLKRLGCSGNGASIGVIARHFSLSGKIFFIQLFYYSAIVTIF